MDPVRRRARKTHRCELCERPIRKGRLHVYERITPWDHWENDHYFTYRAHLSCDRAWHAFGEDWDWYLPGDPVLFREEREAWLVGRRAATKE